MLDVRVLGPLQVRRDGEPVALGARMERALLAVLLLEAGRVVPADRIVDLLWDGAPPATALPTLHTKVAHLRRALQPDRTPRAGGSVLVTAAPGYRLSRDQLTLDADRFEALVARAAAASAEDPARAVALATEALSLWQGPALGEFAGAPFARSAAERWEALRLVAVELHAGALLRLGQVPRAVADLSAHVAGHPLREQARALLARALYHSGRQAEALATLAEGRRLLRTELGLDPGPDLQHLERQILDHDPSLRPAPARWPTADAAPVLTGRDAQRGLVLARLDEAATGAGSVVLVTGDGGIGKSALLETVRAEFDGRGGTTRWATCRDGSAAPPYWPVLHVVGEAAADADEAGRARLRDALGPLLELFPALSPAHDQRAGGAPAGGMDLAGGVDPAMVLVHLTRALETALDQDRPALLVLDDIHLADPATVAVAGNLAARVHRSRTVLALSLRPGEADTPALLDLLASLARLPRVLRLDLQPLPPAAVADVVRAQVAEAGGAAVGGLADDVVDGVVDEVVRRAEGNPFFAVELTRAALNGGTGDPAPAAERGRRPGGVPAPVLDVLRQQVQRLPAGGEALLTAAAVAGSPLRVEELAAMAGAPVEAALTALEAALRARLVVDAGEGRFLLRHALLAEGLLASLSSARAVRLHRALAERLSRAGIRGTPPHEVARIAHHHHAARSLDGGAAALPWLERAADSAMALSALAQARRLHEQVLAVVEAAPDLDPDRRRELRARGRIAYAEVWSLGYDGPAVREYTRLLRSWPVPVPAQPEDMELLWLAAVFENQVGRIDEGDRTVARMAALAEALDDDTATYLWLDMAGALRWMQGRYREALDLLDHANDVVARRAVDLRRSLASSPPTRLGLLRALVSWHLGERDAAVALADEALRTAEAVGLGAAGFARRWALMLALMDGEVQRVGSLVALQLPDSSWESFRYPSAVVAFAAGWLQFRDGETSAGLTAMRTAHATLRDQGLAGGRTVLLGRLAEATLAAADPAEAVALCDAGLALAERGERYWVPHLYRVRALAAERVSAAQAGRKRTAAGCPP